MVELNLVQAIRAIEKEIRSIQAKHRTELQPYEDSLQELRRINSACENCAGQGKVFKRLCAEDDGDWYTCNLCHGTGKKPKEKNKFSF